MKFVNGLLFLASLILVPAVFFISCQTQQAANTTIKDPLDLSAIDSSVRPQDNFFLYANGNWLKTAQIPPSQRAWGAAVELGELLTKNMHSILDSVSKLNAEKGTIGQKVGDLYASAMDSTAIEKLGLLPLKPDLDRISNVKDATGLIDVIAAEYSYGHSPAFSYYPSADEKNSSMVVAHFDQGGIGLPNRDYYFKQDSSIKKIREAYQVYIKKIFQLAGDDSITAGKAALSVMELETSLAKISKTPVELRNPNANYHKIAVVELAKKSPGFEWKMLLDKLGIHQDTVLVGQPEFYAGTGKLIQSLPIADWKSYLRFHLIDDYTAYLSKDFGAAKFNFRKQLTGQKAMRDRWKRMSEMVDQNLGDALGELYVKRFFSAEAKQRMTDLVNNLQQTYEERINGLDWMSDSTKKKALIKLHAIVKKIGYPDKWKDYSSISIAKDSLIDNIRHCAQFEYKRNLNKIGKTVDRSEWYMTPPTEDAYYNPTSNDINFPAGILQPPFFYSDGDDAVNYGAIGLVICHEMTHGFDDEGRQYDADGNLKDWWSAEDAAKFKQKANLAIQQYNGYVVVDTFHINGELTLGENIADIGGLAISYAAFKKTTEGKGNDKIGGLTPDQRFFMSTAQLWRIKFRDEVLRAQVLSDVHSNGKYRVIGPVSNMPGFYEAFGVKPGDAMYRADSVRVHIW